MSAPLDGTTRLCGVIGWPVSHSRSPRMHNAAFAALGLNWAYVPLPVAPERVAEAVRGLAALGFAGANVTVPHKQAVIPCLDKLTPTAAAIGAVNTIVVRSDGSLLGESTDGDGFVADLAEHDVYPRRALVIGAGGAARSVVYALAQAGVIVAVAARREEQAQELCRSLAPAVPTGSLSPHGFPARLDRLAPAADLIVNATSLGLHEDDPLPWDESVPLGRGQTIYDLIYNRPTPLLALAAARGARAIDGLGMLVHQGARAFELWTGLATPVQVMRAAIEPSVS